jgi:acetoin utilization protein AcuC
MKNAFIYSEKFADFSYGQGHPMRPARLRLTKELIDHLSLLTNAENELIEARRGTDLEILTTHSKEYLAVLKDADSGSAPENGPQFGIGMGDCPAFAGVFE